MLKMPETILGAPNGGLTSYTGMEAQMAAAKVVKSINGGGGQFLSSVHLPFRVKVFGGKPQTKSNIPKQIIRGACLRASFRYAMRISVSTFFSEKSQMARRRFVFKEIAKMWTMRFRCKENF